MKNILVLSNNPFSYTQHNAKTVLSLIGDSSFNLFQLYLRNGSPTFSNARYYQICDNDVLKSIFTFKKAGLRVEPKVNADTSESFKKKSNFARLLREFVWIFAHVNYCDLFKWITDNDINVIFFVGGDCWFSYRIYMKICKKIPSLKKIIYLTDDYILPKNRFDIFEFWRRKVLRKHMSKSVPQADALITISEKMRRTYLSIFGKDSFVYSFVPQKVVSCNQNLILKNDLKHLNFAYAGGLHYNRWKILGKLAQAFQEINLKYGFDWKLSIYSQYELSKKINKVLNVEGTSKFCGFVSGTELTNILKENDILVFAESFDKRSIGYTKLSFSTKVFELISFEKPILVIGPSTVGSIEYLMNENLFITSLENIRADYIMNVVTVEKINSSIMFCKKEVEKIYADDSKKTIIESINNMIGV